MSLIQAPADLQQLLDRAAIRDVLARYFLGLDREEPAMVRSCFTADVRANYDGRPPVTDVDALMGSLRVWKETAQGKIKCTTHFIGTLNFRALDAASSHTEAYAIAYLLETAGGDQVNMRSLRYIDRWRRTAEGWRICERTHTLDWSCLAPAVHVRVAEGFMRAAQGAVA